MWHDMIHRCYNANNVSYQRYGGRGITVCDRWRESVYAFLDDMGPRPSEKHSIDRYPNNDGNYEPGNCRWATQQEQIDNSSVPRLILFRGVTRSVSCWSRALGIDHRTLFKRLSSGWSIEDALTLPVRKEFSRGNRKLLGGK